MQEDAEEAEDWGCQVIACVAKVRIISTGLRFVQSALPSVCGTRDVQSSDALPSFTTRYLSDTLGLCRGSLALGKGTLTALLPAFIPCL